MKVLTDEEVKKAFGDPEPYYHDDGNISPGWPNKILEYAKIPGRGLPLSWNKKIFVNRFRCHFLLVKTFTQIFTTLTEIPDAWATINDFGGCYEWRTQRRTKKSLSRHCWGIAIDLDACDNPFGREPNMHPRIIEVFREHGFVWGGTFAPKRRDGMHFEFADLTKL